MATVTLKTLYHSVAHRNFCQLHENHAITMPEKNNANQNVSTD